MCSAEAIQHQKARSKTYKMKLKSRSNRKEAMERILMKILIVTKMLKLSFLVDVTQIPTISRE
jgi:hypothetical protein